LAARGGKSSSAKAKIWELKVRCRVRGAGGD